MVAGDRRRGAVDVVDHAAAPRRLWEHLCRRLKRAGAKAAATRPPEPAPPALRALRARSSWRGLARRGAHQASMLACPAQALGRVSRLRAAFCCCLDKQPGAGTSTEAPSRRG